jgi:hypothetical protein
MRVGCTLQNCVKAGVFASRQQSRSEGALRAASPVPILPSLIGNGRDAIFMNRDVVEIAQAILHAFQPREELLPALRRFLAREKAPHDLGSFCQKLKFGCTSFFINSRCYSGAGQLAKSEPSGITACG